MEIKVSISGDRAIAQALGDPALIAGPLKDLLASGAAIVERKAKEVVPIDTGYLARNITREIAPLRARVYTNVLYAPFVEYGTKPHEIVPVHARALAWQAGGKLGRGTRRRGRTGMIGGGAWVFARRVHHPGTRPQPYMRPGAAELEQRLPELLAGLARDIEENWRRKHGG